MSTVSIIPKTRSVLWRRLFLTEQVIVAIGFVVYAILVSIGQLVRSVLMKRSLEHEA